MNTASPPSYRSSQDALSTATPVSVIMTVRNEERHLDEAVRRVLAQDYPAEIEVVIAVGPSHDATAEIARRLAADDPRVTVVDNPSGQIPAGNNAAIKATRFPVVARVDGHSFLPPGYLTLAVQTLAETGADNVGGVMAAEGVTAFGRAVAWAMTSPAGVGRAQFHTGGGAGPASSVYLGVYRRVALERVGGYDEGYLRAEDWEMNHRIRQAGGVIWFQPRLRVTYRPRASLRALATQYFHYGRWRRVICRGHTGTASLRYLAPPVAVLAMAAGLTLGLAGLAAALAAPGGAGAAGPGAAGPGAAAWLMLGFAVPAGYLCGVLAVTARAARDLPPRVLTRLPAALVVMHVFWGIGFLTSPRRLLAGRALSPGR